MTVRPISFLGQLARAGILRDEPGGQRFFVTDLNGPLYILNKQTKQLTPYLNFDGTGDRPGLFPKFTAAMGFAAGLMNFVFDPDYARNGIFYTLHMESLSTPGDNAMPKTGVTPGLNLAGYTTTSALATPIIANAAFSRDMVIVEWTDRQIGNTTFEGTAREVFRMQLPGLFHPLNEMTFNPAARPGDPDWRVMYLGVGDSGTGERPGPMRMHAQRLDTLHGKILRIIPMLSEHASTSTVSENGRYRIPNDNPFVSIEGARKEIWALGLRNPHRLTWDVDPARPREPVLLAFNIGLVSWETVMIIKKGANYGYPLREGTQSMSATNGMGPLPADDVIPVQISDTVTRGTVKPSYPVAAYPHAPGGGDAIANGFVYRGKRLPALQGTLVFGDITTGRIWYAQMKELLAADDGNPLTLAPLHELGTRLRALSEETFRRRGGKGDSLPGRGAVAGRRSCRRPAGRGQRRRTVRIDQRGRHDPRSSKRSIRAWETQHEHLHASLHRCARLRPAGRRFDHVRPPRAVAASSPLVLPAGFQAEVFAEKVENARSMAIGPQGTVFVGSQYVGKVHAIVDSRQGPQGRSRCRRRQRSRSAQRRGDAQRRPVCGDREPAAAIRRHRKAPRRAARAGHVCATTCPTRRRATPGSSSPSAPTTCSTCRSVRRATSAHRRR